MASARYALCPDAFGVSVGTALTRRAVRTLEDTRAVVVTSGGQDRPSLCLAKSGHPHSRSGDLSVSAGLQEIRDVTRSQTSPSDDRFMNLEYQGTNSVFPKHLRGA